MAGQHDTDILNHQQPHLVLAGSHKSSMYAHKLRNAISTMEEVPTQAELPSCDLQGCIFSKPGSAILTVQPVHKPEEEN